MVLAQGKPKDKRNKMENSETTLNSVDHENCRGGNESVFIKYSARST